MKKNILKISFILCVALFILCVCNTISNAASFDASISKTSVKVGDTFTVTVKANNAAGNYSVSASNANVTLISGNESEFLENSSTTLTYKATAAGKVSIVAKATDMTDLDNSSVAVTGSKSFNVTINEESTGGTTNGSTSGNAGTSTGGSNNNGGSTSGSNNAGTTQTPTVKEPKFTSASKTVYATGEINLRSSWSTSSSATVVSKGTQLQLTGTSTEKVNGYVWYRVTYNGKIRYVSKDLITETKPEEEKSNNANLKILNIENAQLTPVFNANVTEYSVKLTDYKDTKINVTAEAEDEKSTVKIEGTESIKFGENTVNITVTAEDETTKIYTVKVINENTTVLGLSNLIIRNLEFENFSPSIYEYAVEFKDLDKLDIVATANEEGATVEIIGNENLVKGENIITIIVTSEDGTKTATYQIKATKLATVAQEETKQINGKSILISALIAVVVLIIIIILVSKYAKKDNGIDYVYNDNLESKKDDVEVAKEITPEKIKEVEELQSDRDYEEEKPRRSRKGKHSK